MGKKGTAAGAALSLIAAVLLTSCGQGPPASTISSPGTTTAVETTAASAAETTTGSAEESGTSADGRTQVQTETPASKPPNKPTTTVVKKTVAATTTVRKTTTTARVKQLYDRKTSDIGFGYYGMTPDSLELDMSAIEYMKTDHTNTVIISSSPGELTYGLQQCKTYNCKAWVGIDVFGPDRRLRENWQSIVNDVVAEAKASGAYDAMLGFYLDEPLLGGCTREDLYTLTKYNHDKIGKRFFICFAVAGVAPEVYDDPNCSPPLTPETGKYITDIGFDMYWEFDANKSKYDEIIRLMKQRSGNEAVRIWYIPWAYTDQTDDAATLTRLNKECTRHLQAMYDYLKQEKHPGGLMVFLYDGSSLGFTGIRQAGDGLWKGLKQECERIGREICTGKMN